MGSLPIQLTISGRLCVVAGSNEAAKHLAATLADCGARVRVVAPDATAEGWPLGADRYPRALSERDLEGALLVVVATGDRGHDETIANLARRMGALVHLTGAVGAGDFRLLGSAEVKAPGAAGELRTHAAEALSGRQSVGRVFLVGAGPGDPGLITAKGAACLRKADAVFYDALVNPILLSMYCANAICIPVRKRKGACERTQDEIQELLIDRALRGEVVVRLKGGDPLVFGRGSEEARALREAGVPFEIVPGVSSAIAVPAYAGIAITARDVGSSVGVYSAHRRGGLAVDDREWERIAGGPDTLVVLMGKTKLSELAHQLVKHGRSASTPAAIIFNGTLPNQRTVVGTLEDLPGRVAGMRSSTEEDPGPALVVIGDAVRTRSYMDWFEPSAARGDGRRRQVASQPTPP